MSEESAQGLGRRLLKSAAQFSAGQIASMLASITRIAIAARYLSTDANGNWLAMQLVLSYGANLHFGSLYGVFRSIPMLRAQGKDVEAEAERRTSFTFTGFMAIVSLVPVFVVTSRVCPNASTRHVLGAVGLVSLSLLRSYYNAIFKAESRFKELASGMVWGSLASFASVLLIVRWGLDGLILSTAIQGVVETGYLTVRSTLPRPGIERRVLYHQIRVGFVTLLTSVGVLLLTTVDRTVMIHRLGPEATGNYYIGANIMVLMPIIAALPATVLTPQFFARVGRGEKLQPLIERPVHLAALTFAVLVAIGSITTSPVIALLWPKLAGGTAAAHAALFATFPLVLSGLVTNVYYAHDRQGLHVVILLLCSALSFGLAHLGVSLTHSITGSAIGAAVGLYVYNLAATTGAYYVLGDTRAGVVLALRSSIPIVYAGGASLLVEYVLMRAMPGSVVVRGGIGLAIVAVLVLPLLALLRRRVRAGLTGS